jgi:hypothetical protein
MGVNRVCTIAEDWWALSIERQSARCLMHFAALFLPSKKGRSFAQQNCRGKMHMVKAEWMETGEFGV